MPYFINIPNNESYLTTPSTTPLTTPPTTPQVTTLLAKLGEASPDAKRLYDDLLRKSRYNKLIRPVGNNSDILMVNLGLRLTQIIDVVSIIISQHPGTLLVTAYISKSVTAINYWQSSNDTINY